MSVRLAFQFANLNLSCVGFTCRTLVSARLAFEFAKSLYQWQLHPQHLKAIRRSAHVQRALLVNAFQDMSSLAAERVKMEFVSGRIAKVVQCITCAAGAITMQSLATSLTRFAKTVSASVAIAQAAVLAAATKMGALKTVLVFLIHRHGAAHARILGRAPSAEVRRALLRNHRQGQCATIAVRL